MDLNKLLANTKKFDQAAQGPINFLLYSEICYCLLTGGFVTALLYRYRTNFLKQKMFLLNTGAMAFGVLSSVLAKMALTSRSISLGVGFFFYNCLLISSAVLTTGYLVLGFKNLLKSRRTAGDTLAGIFSIGLMTPVLIISVVGVSFWGRYSGFATTF